MIQVRLFGSFDVRDGTGRSITAVLQQPKRAALLAYLAASPAGTFHRRDRLVALFWPEADEAHARNALSSSLRFLRKALGDAAIVGRGAEELSVDSSLVWSDVAVFGAAIRAADSRAALELYRGELLTSFHLSGTSGFDEWLEQERARYRRLAASAAAALAEQATASGELAMAAHWARIASEISPDDEAAIRRLLLALDHAGDRAGALRLYDAFATRLRDEYGLEPAPETTAARDGVGLAVRSGSGGDPRQVVDLGRPVDSPPWRTTGEDSGTSAVAEQPGDDRGHVLTKPVDASSAPSARPAVHGDRRRRFALVAGVAALCIAGVSLAAGASLWRSPPSSPHPSAPTVAIHAFRNTTGDSRLDYVGEAIARILASGLTTLGSVQIVSSGPGRQEVTYSISGSYHTVGDSLEFVTEIIDVARDRSLAAPEPSRARISDPLAASDRIRSRAVGALAYYTAAFAGSLYLQRRPPSYDAYLAYQEGVRAVGHVDVNAAEAAFRRAIQLDSSYTEAYALLGGFVLINRGELAWSRGGNLVGVNALDSLATAMEHAIPVLTEPDRLVILWLRALGRHDRQTALLVRQRLAKWMPNSPSALLAEAVRANRPRLALEVADQLSFHEFGARDWHSVASAHHQLGDHAEELRVAMRGRASSMNHSFLLSAEARARLARGDLEGFRRVVSEMRFRPVHAMQLGLELRAHGHEQESERLMLHVLARPDSAPPHQRNTFTAMALLTLGRLDEAVDFLEPLVARDTMRIDLTGLLATAYARAGRDEDARRLSEEIALASEPALGGLTTLWRARIAARLGERERATELLALAFKQGVPHNPLFPAAGGTYWHSDPDFEPLRDFKPFADLVRPR